MVGVAGEERRWPAGRGPGEQVGRCLFGTAVGVPRIEVFNDNDVDGGAADFVRLEGLVTTVAITVLMAAKRL